MASNDTVVLSEPHEPKQRAKEAFNKVLPQIKLAVTSSRHDWDKHEPRMWKRANELNDDTLTNFVIENDLIEVRAGATSYGTIIFGKIRIPNINDEEGEGFIHVSISDVTGFTIHQIMYGSHIVITNDHSTERVGTFQGTGDVMFHSLLTEEGNRDADGKPTTFRAIQTRETPLEFFNE